MTMEFGLNCLTSRVAYRPECVFALRQMEVEYCDGDPQHGFCFLELEFDCSWHLEQINQQWSKLAAGKEAQVNISRSVWNDWFAVDSSLRIPLQTFVVCNLSGDYHRGSRSLRRGCLLRNEVG